MSNLKSNIKIIIIYLIGFLFFGLISFHLINSALKPRYPQIAGIILGGFFGLFALLSFAGLIFSLKPNIFPSSAENIKVNWSFLKYFPLTLALICFVLAFRFYFKKSDQFNNEYKQIVVTQTNTPKIQSVKSSKYISIETKEINDFSFQIGGVAYKSMYVDYYLQNVKIGDTLRLWILKDSYDKKISKTKPLTFTDKSVNYQIIYVFGLKHKDFQVLSINDYEYSKENDSKFGVIFFIVIGLIFLYLQKRALNEKK